MNQWGILVVCSLFEQPEAEVARPLKINEPALDGRFG